jgi:hypothetical protein
MRQVLFIGKLRLRLRRDTRFPANRCRRKPNATALSLVLDAPDSAYYAHSIAL